MTEAAAENTGTLPESVVAAVDEAELADWNPTIIPDEEYDRRKYIGGSNAAAIMGFGATYDGVQQTAYGVWEAKLAESAETELPPEKKKFLERRKRWEPVVIEMLREELDVEVVAVNRRYRDPKLPFLAAEIDFEWRDEDGSIQNGEIKTVSPLAYGERHGWGEAGTSDVPIHYEAQIHHGLSVTGRRKAILAALVGIDSYVFYRIDRNPDLIYQMRKAEENFWRCVIEKRPPDPQTLRDLALKFKTSNGLSVEATSEIGSKALALRALRGQIAALEMQQDSLEFDVKLALAEYESLTVDGRKIFTWKEQATTHFQTSSLKESKDPTEKEIYRKYLKKGSTRVFKGASWN